MNLFEIILFLIILIFSVSFHEAFHGWTAYKLGDSTAKLMGRLTLNPIAHIDPIGTIVFPLALLLFSGGRVVFGWAKPVPINFASLKNPKRDMMLIGFSGPLANILLALLLSLIIKTGLIKNMSLLQLLISGVTINLILAVFNLMPIPPLDGSQILTGILPHRWAVSYSKLQPYGFLILFAMLYLGIIGKIIYPIINFLARILL